MPLFKGPRNTIVLTSITGRDHWDIICFHSEVSWSAFRDYTIANHIGYERITTDRAAKILKKQGGVGYGCYTMDGVTSNHDKEREYRRALAKSKKTDIANIIGICSIFEPLELRVDQKATEQPQAA